MSNLPTLLSFDSRINLETVDSTNLYLQNPSIQPGVWVTSREQSAGRGRKGKTWNRIGEESIIFSGKFFFPEPKFPISLLPLVTGIAVFKSCKIANPNAVLNFKWPNDVYLENKKISGVLVESFWKGNDLEVISGIGMNLYGRKAPEALEQAGYLFQSNHFDKENIIKTLVNSLNDIYAKLILPGAIQEEIDYISSSSYLTGKKIEDRVGDKLISGKVEGISGEGFLLVRTPEGNLISLIDTSEQFRTV